MRVPRLAVIAVSSAFLVACAALTTTAEAPTRRVSPDNAAAGRTEWVRAHVHAQYIELEFTKAPDSLAVTDANGVPVGFEKNGQYYRLARKLDDFTVRTNLGSTVFHLAKPTQPVAAAPEVPVVSQTVPPASVQPVAPTPEAPARPAPVAAPVASRTTQPAPVQPADVDVAALLKITEQQLDDVRKIIAHGARGEHDLQALNRKLDRIEAEIATASVAVLMVHFNSYQTHFRPSPELSRVLVSAAKAADQVNLRGRTDSVVPGPLDPKIARARAMSARRFLVSHGVPPSKIRVYSLPAGDFIAPHTTAEGKAQNRRVMIEIVNRRIAALAQQNRELTLGAGQNSAR